MRLARLSSLVQYAFRSSLLFLRRLGGGGRALVSQALSTPYTENRTNSPGTASSSPQQMDKFVRTYQKLLFAPRGPSLPVAWERACRQAPGISAAACRTEAERLGLPVPDLPDEAVGEAEQQDAATVTFAVDAPAHRGRPRDPAVTEFMDEYTRARTDLANLYSLAADDPDVCRAAWRIATEYRPTAVGAARMRCRRAGIPLPPRGRPPAADDMPPVPRVACKRTGTACLDGAWALRTSTHLGPSVTRGSRVRTNGSAIEKRLIGEFRARHRAARIRGALQRDGASRERALKWLAAKACLLQQPRP